MKVGGGVISGGGILEGFVGCGQDFGFYSKRYRKSLEGLEKKLLLLEAIAGCKVKLAMETRDQLMSPMQSSQPLIMMAWAWWPTPVGEAVKMTGYARKASEQRPQDLLMDRM